MIYNAHIDTHTQTHTITLVFLGAHIHACIKWYIPQQSPCTRRGAMGNRIDVISVVVS